MQLIAEKILLELDTAESKTAKIDILKQYLELVRDGGEYSEQGIVLPPLKPGEILWFFCSNCGHRRLNAEIEYYDPEIVGPFTGILCDCGNNQYIRLGTNQGKYWKQYYLNK